MGETRDNRVIPAVVAALASAATVGFLMKRRQRKAKKSAPTKLCLYGFLPLPPDGDCSPACLKLLTFFKMTKTEYDFVPFTKHEMKESPKGKIPWVHGAVLGEEPVPDSSLIMDALIRADPEKYDLDTHLSDQERAIGTAFKVMLEESTYFHGLHVRWNTDEFKRYSVPLYLGTVPAMIRGIIARQVQKKIIRDLNGQGTGLLTDEEVLSKAEKEIMAISDFLGSKPYLLGDRISSFDATAYAFLAFLIQGGWQHPICVAARASRNIVDYVERMRKEFWPELQAT